MVKNKILKRIVAGLSCIALSTTMLTSLPAFADDYVDEYQYYSTLDPNGEEYQEWKSNLASSAVSVPQNRMLKSILKNNTLIANDYIEFNTASNGHYTIGTIGGNPNSSTDDNKKMLFGHPGGGTSKTTIVVGESINEFTSSNVTYDVAADALRGSSCQKGTAASAFRSVPASFPRYTSHRAFCSGWVL